MQEKVHQEKLKEVQIKSKSQVRDMGNALISKIQKDMIEEFHSLFMQFDDCKTECAELEEKN
jgi:hypothetical protein